MSTVIPEPWAEVINEFLSFHAAGGAAASTLRLRREHLEHLARRIGKPPAEVTGRDLVAYVAAQSWARETRRGRRATFRSLWGWMVSTGEATENAAAILPSVRPSEPAPRPVSEADYKRALLRAKPREQLMLRLSAELGLRRAEVAVIHAHDIYEDLGGYSLIVHGKGGKRRHVPLPAGLALTLLEAAAGGYAFPGDDHGHISPRWAGKLVGRLLPAGVTMHGLRHRFASRAWATGVDVFVLQSLLGHASGDTTRRYVAIPQAAEREAIEKLSRSA